MKILYTTKGLVTGDRNGHGQSDDGQLNVELALPVELGGSGKGTNPEQLFAVGYAACFMSAIKNVAKKENVEIDSQSNIECTVNIGLTEQQTFGLSAKLAVYLPNLDLTVAQGILDKAHQICPYSNATRNNIDVQLSVSV